METVTDSSEEVKLYQPITDQVLPSTPHPTMILTSKDCDFGMQFKIECPSYNPGVITLGYNYFNFAWESWKFITFNPVKSYNPN